MMQKVYAFENLKPPSTCQASSHPPPTSSLTVQQQFLFTNFCLFVYCVPGKLRGGSRWGGSCCCVCIVHKGLTGRTRSLTTPYPPPLLALPWPQSSARRAKSCKHFFCLVFCCPVPLNRQIPDAIMRRLVKLSHSRSGTAKRHLPLGFKIHIDHMTGILNICGLCGLLMSSRNEGTRREGANEKSKEQQMIMTILKTA